MGWTSGQSTCSELLFKIDTDFGIQNSTNRLFCSVGCEKKTIEYSSFAVQKNKL